MAVYDHAGRNSYGTTVAHRNGDWFVGGQLAHHDVELSRVAVGFDDDASDTLSDEWDENTESSADWGVDLGVIWEPGQYRLGAQVRNLIEPSFDYPQIEENDLYEAAVSRGEISEDASYTMERQFAIEGGWNSRGERWHVGGALDLNAIDGPFADGSKADEYQWLTIGTAYEPQSWYWPMWRAGYRQNLSGSELGYVTGGVTLFSAWSIDLAVATESVDSAPRGVMFNTGVELSF